ncbi:MAG: CRTAC1 family protein [Bryobacterales bacterium]|nr:CRTAC1 family protein [Bryobacterales bacterium]
MCNWRRLALVSSAILLGATCLWPQGVSTRNAPAEPRTKPSGRPFGASFTDVAAEAGLRRRVLAGGKHTHRYIVEANGTGVALVDFDNDGYLDAFMVDSSRIEPPPADTGNRLYRNLGNGKFADVTAAAGAGQRGWGNGVCAGDFDNNGFTDLFVTYWGRNVLLRNTGAGKFEEVAAKAGVAGDGNAWHTGCTFLDYDRDGRLDLFVTSYLEFDLKTTGLPGSGANCLWKGMPVFCGPRGLPYGRAWLYHNRGDGTFEDVSVRSRVAETIGFYGFTAVAADLTGDGWVDIYVASDSTPSLLFRNNRDGTFSEIGAEAGVAFSEHGHEQGGMGVAVGDYDGDGRLDLVKTNFAGDHSTLYRNLGKGIFEDVVIRAGMGVNPFFVAWGVGFADFDNDNWPDLLQVNGHVYPELEAKQGAERYRNPRILYRNLGTGRLEDVSAAGGTGVLAEHSSRGAAFGDFDNDGDVDVLVMNMGEPPSLLRNDLKTGSHWIRIRLEGVKSNRSAIGAQVVVETDGRKQRQAVLSQSSFLSQNDLRLHFGLGPAERVDAVVVYWPSGAAEQFAGIGGGQTVVLKEGSGK